jgi:uncharacterized protein YbjT (DUF2867 family)
LQDTGSTTNESKGSNILSTLLKHSSFATVYAYTRKPLSDTSDKLKPVESKDSDKWPTLFPTDAKPSIFFSALGTTRAQAGGLENQRKIDLDLNLALAKSAKEAGVTTYVLISAAGASSSSRLPYSKLKGELEDEVKKLEFKHTVILNPGLIVGQREDSRALESGFRTIANAIGSISGNKLKDFWAQDAHVIARAAVSAGLQILEGKKEPGVWTIGQAEIVKLGRTEWKE